MLRMISRVLSALALLCWILMPFEGAAQFENGANDFRISTSGGTGNITYQASSSDVAFNSTDMQFLVVWDAENNSGGLVNNESEIWGRFYNSICEPIGTQFRISSQGGTGDPDYDAIRPSVAYNSTDNEYMVVWQGDSIPGENEIYAQRMSNIGIFIGSAAQISNSSTPAINSFDGQEPDIAYNATNIEYILIWEDDVPGNGESEIMFCRLSNIGVVLGSGQQRLTITGVDGITSWDAVNPAIAWNPNSNSYFAVWSQDRIGNEDEIYGREISNVGVMIGGGALRLSDMGVDNNLDYDGYEPYIVYNATDNEYLVVWEGDDDNGGHVDSEFEIYGQRITTAGAELGTNDFLISEMGVLGNAAYNAHDPTAIWLSATNEFWVFWESDHNDPATLAAGEDEIWMRKISNTGALVGVLYKFSDMGPDGTAAYDAYDPAVAVNQTTEQVLLTWRGDDNVGGLIEDEHEIFGQIISTTQMNVVISAGPTPSYTTEDGAFATVAFSLSTEPTGDVTIPLSLSDPTEGSLSVASITIPINSWNKLNIVTITGVDDPIIDGDIIYMLQTGDVTSTDVCYDGIDADRSPDVNMLNIDNEFTARISKRDTNGDGIADIMDPCSCADAIEIGNIRYFKETVTIVTSLPNNWELSVVNSGQLYDGVGNIIPIGTLLTPVGPGLFQLVFYHKAGVGYNADFRETSDAFPILTIGNSCNNSKCIIYPVPTMSEWGLLGFVLLLASLGLILLKKGQLKFSER